MEVRVFKTVAGRRSQERAAVISTDENAVSRFGRPSATKVLKLMEQRIHELPANETLSAHVYNADGDKVTKSGFLHARIERGVLMRRPVTRKRRRINR